MKNLKNTIALIILTIACNTFAVAQLSDAFISNNGELSNNDFTVKNEVDNSQEIVKKFYYNADGHLVCQRNYDFESRLAYDERGVSIYEYQYDANNNITEERYFDEEKNYFKQESIGAAIIKRQFDTNNRVIEISYFLDEQTKLQFGTSSIKYNYSADGTSAIEKHFAPDGQLVDFCAPIVLVEFNGTGQIIKKTYQTSEQKTCGRFMDGDKDEVAVIMYEYDNGKLINQKAFNKEGKLIGEIPA